MPSTSRVDFIREKKHLQKERDQRKEKNCKSKIYDWTLDLQKIMLTKSKSPEYQPCSQTITSMIGVEVETIVTNKKDKEKYKTTNK